MIDTKSFKKAMTSIYQTIVKEKQFLEGHGIATQGTSEKENIDHLIQRSRGTAFKLLVMGEFSSGKSAFVNVLLGEKLLPEGALPMTALITEIYYGKEKKVVIHPRPGKWKGGDAPFEIEPKLSEIEKFSTIDNVAGINKKEANRVDSCFEKMVVRWPLDILKDGVVIVDSPGLNDPFSNDYIVQNYVPRADAILFCVNGTKAYSAEDRRTLQIINSEGFKNPIMVTTYFDVVTEGMEQKKIQEFINITNGKYKNHTEEEFCHYVNSRLGMAAKNNNSQSQLVESGYYELEQFLTKYLTEYKGKEKISAATSSIKAYNSGQRKSLNGIISNLDVPLDVFNERIAKTQERLDQAKRRGNLLIREFRLELGQDRKEMMDKVVPEFYNDLYNSINLDNFEPDTNFQMLHPQKSSQQIADECSKELELRNKQFVAEWNKKVLAPAMAKSFKKAAAKMEKQFNAFSEEVKNANFTLRTEMGMVDTDVSAGTRVAMLVYALFTGDWLTALMGGAFGAGAFGRAITCQFTAAIILSLISLFTPIGLAGIAVAGIAALITAGGWNMAVAADNIKKSTVKEMRRYLVENKEQIIKKVSDECTKIFDRMEGRLKQAIDDDIREVERNIKKIKAERQRNEDEARMRKEEFQKVIAYLDDVDARMDMIRGNFQIK